MQRFNNFVKQSIIGGLLVFAPATILFFAFRWVFNTVATLIEPLVTALGKHSNADIIIIDLVVIGLILVACFIVGTLVTTGAGKWLHARFDNTLAKLAPGYNLVRDIVHQLFGDNTDSPFKKGEVALVKLFGPDVATTTTAIITSTHSNGWFTVFVPTGPNPTSGLIYHLPAAQVELLPHIKVDEAMRTIISCGAGSAEMLARNQRLQVAR